MNWLGILVKWIQALMSCLFFHILFILTLAVWYGHRQPCSLAGQVGILFVHWIQLVMTHVRMQVKFLCNVSFKEGWANSTGSLAAIEITGCTDSQKTEEAAGEVPRVVDPWLPCTWGISCICSFEPCKFSDLALLASAAAHLLVFGNE